jgi:hypothetical protein
MQTKTDAARRRKGNMKTTILIAVIGAVLVALPGNLLTPHADPGVESARIALLESLAQTARMGCVIGRMGGTQDDAERVIRQISAGKTNAFREWVADHAIIKCPAVIMPWLPTNYIVVTNAVWSTQ